ncbi:MAG: class A beta-lactamase [Hyphomonadaceae bacterium]|nr:class A beta-lactamase [Hyphomonadaceae bacterium]
MLTRRDTLLGAAALGACAPLEQRSTYTPPPNDPRFAAIEERIGGRVGVAAWNTGTGDWIGRRIQERFAMCSTFKWMLAAQMLFFDMHMPDHLLQRIPFTESDLLDYAPVAREHLSRGWISVAEAAEGTVVMSDNTCANLLLRVGDGPQGLTHFLQVYGDGTTRLDRTEPTLNENLPNDPRDTTTPDAMARTMQRFLLTDEVLNGTSRNRLTGWMEQSPTGRQRLRAGLPSTWRVGDKTGTWNGEHNATNDVAIAWPPNGAPIVIAAYLSDSTGNAAARNAAHAEIGRIIAEEWG